ncbi:MAG: ABC transporter permease subunit [Alphaproteobacteria bacterium]|nr:ABC transporter permease subunit [Alphaproteobacteria bacterium]
MSPARKKSLLLLSPFLAVMGAFFLMPLLLIAAYSFLQAGPNGGVVWHFSWDAYVQILYTRDFDGTLVFDAGYLQIFWRSLKLAGICTALCLLAGFPMAWHMATRPPEKRNLWIMLVTIPFWTNLLIRTYAWMLILRTDGLVNNALVKTHLIAQPLTLLYNDFSIGLGLLYSYLPFMVLPIYANLERMDWRLVEAAQDLYATRAQTLRRVILPLAAPGILAGCVLVFIPAIGSFLAPDLLGGGKRMMIGTLIANQFSFARNWPFGAAASVVLMAVVMLGLMLMARKGRGLQSLV